LETNFLQDSSNCYKLKDYLGWISPSENPQIYTIILPNELKLNAHPIQGSLLGMMKRKMDLQSNKIIIHMKDGKISFPSRDLSEASSLS
jgi:hypothetical protein